MNIFRHYDIAESDLFPGIGRYVTHIETGETKDTCKCTWLEEHNTGLKLQRVEESLECPVHTKEGFILGFFRFMFPDMEIERPNPDGPHDVYVNLGESTLPAALTMAQNTKERDLSAVLSARIHDQETDGQRD